MEDFVAPTFEIIDFPRNFDVLLISARGATGKSTLAQELSNTKVVPLWDLGHKDSVAVSGDAFASRISSYSSQIVSPDEILPAEGAFVIIDAMDEARSRVSGQSWSEFVKSLIRVSSSAHPVVLLGRERILEDLWLQFSEAGKEVAWLEISHFDLQQRTRYVDSRVARRDDIDSQWYAPARDAVIEALAGTVDDSLSQAFVGYAPVLDAVVALLRGGNHHAIYGDFAKSDANASIAVLVDVLEHLLAREQLKVRPIAEKLQVPNPGSAHSRAEQIQWLVSELLAGDQPTMEWCPPRLKAEYADQLHPLLSDHPFRNAGSWASPVFSAYVASVVFGQPAIRDNLQQIGSSTSLLYEFVSRASASEILDEWQFAALHSSLLASESRAVEAVVELDSGDLGTASAVDTATGKFLLAEIDKLRPSLEFTLVVDQPGTLDLRGPLASLSINFPGRVEVRPGEASIVMGPDCMISCHQLSLTGDSVRVARRMTDGVGDDTSVILEIRERFECNGPLVDGPPREAFEIRTPEKVRLNFPWITYRVDLNEALEEPSQRSIRFMNMLMNLCRTHGHREGFAVFDKKLEGRQSIKGEDLVRVLNLLEGRGVIHKVGPMVFLSDDSAAHRFSGKKLPGRSTIDDPDVKAWWGETLAEISRSIS